MFRLDNMTVWSLLALHGVLLVSLLLGGNRQTRLSGGEMLFCALLPIFGPLCGFLLLWSPPPEEGLLQDMIMREDPLRRSYTTPEPEAASTVPMEEAFLISEPQVRREMMMKLLHNDPEENIELLMMARFNDDPETAHYATATLTEYQRRTEMALQQSQMRLAREPEDNEARLDYIRQMEAYIESGLLEGHLLTRQRTLLEKELGLLPADQSDLALGCLRSRNLLALGKTQEAANIARALTARFPRAEEPWLELMRIAVDSRDVQGLRALRKQMDESGILWSYSGQEKMEYFLKGIE